MRFLTNIYKGFKLLLRNPYLFLLYIKKFLFYIFIFPIFKCSRVRLKKFGDVVLGLDFEKYPTYGFGGSLAEQLFDIYQPEVFLCIKQNLKPNNIFFDVGAAIGYFTALGASIVGKEGEVHAFEPSLSSVEYLNKLASANSNYKIIVNHCAVGDKEGDFKIYYSNLLSGDYSLVPNIYEVKKMGVRGNKLVRVIRLDNYIKQKGLNKIDVIKIDVEGYEFPVLKGLENYFKEKSHRPVIICEVDPTAYSLLGSSLEELKEYMEQYGYESYDPFFLTKINLVDLRKAQDILFKAS